MLTELGPYLLNDDSLKTEAYRQTGIPTPLYNPFGWSRLGSLLSFDQPAPVGFSYCNSPEEDAEHPHSCGGLAWTDELATQNAYLALQAFYDKFPCLKQKDLFLTGESYAGIYIPTLAREIVRHNDENDVSIPLKGFAVGDGCLGTETGICSDLWQTPNHFDVWNAVFLAGHGQVSMRTFQEVMKACRPTDDEDDSDDDFVQLFLRGVTAGGERGPAAEAEAWWNNNHSDSVCQAAVAKMTAQAGGVYAYGLYDECTYRNGMTLQGGLNDYPCGGDIVMTDYLQLDAVRQALHVRSDFFSVDNAAGDFDYTPTEKDLTGFYQEQNGRLRILVYNGDTDPAINSFAAQNWTSHLGLAETAEWRPWTSDGCQRMGGYVTRYEGDFDYLTIRGAGHMVPAIKAVAAFAFMEAWITGRDYPIYDKDCKAPSRESSSRATTEEDVVVVAAARSNAEGKTRLRQE